MDKLVYENLLFNLPPVAEQRLEHPAHLGLRFPDPRLQRREIRRVAGPRHHAQQVFARAFRLEFSLTQSRRICVRS